MPETAFLFQSGPLQLDDIVFDALVTEQHTNVLQVTDHPVEKGADITDHARKKPDTISLEAVFSDSSGALPERGRAIAIYNKLRQLQADAKLVTVITSLRAYENMILESISTPRTAKEAGGVKCTLALRQVELVQNKTTVVTVTKDPITKKKVSTGKQPAKEAANSEQVYRSSAKTFTNFVGITDSQGAK